MLSGWTKFINISLYNNITTLTGYQVKFIINRCTGNNDGDNIYVGTSCREDYGDLRFTDTSDNLLPYWIEPGYTSSSATVWVKLTLTTTAYTSIVLQYANTNTSTITTSNGDNTFIFFDDFTGTVGSTPNASKWVVDKKGSASSVVQLDGNGNVQLAGVSTVNSSANIRSVSTIPKTTSLGFSIEYSDKTDNKYYGTTNVGTSSTIQDTAGLTSGGSWWFTVLGNGYGSFLNNTSDYQALVRNPLAGSTVTLFTSSTLNTITLNTYYRRTFSYTPSNVLTSTINGTIAISGTDSTYTTGNFYLLFSQGEYTNGNGGNRYIDWVFVRALAAAEPTKYYPQPLSNWVYKQSHIITLPTTDYQVMFTLINTSGTSTGSTIYLNGRANADFSDVRFTDNHENELPYWIESITGSTAIVWVRIPASSTIWIYYDNDSASTTSNGNTTFQFFDDFERTDLSDWTVIYGTGGTIVQDTTVKYHDAGSGKFTTSTSSVDVARRKLLTTPLTTGCVLEARVYRPTTSGYVHIPNINSYGGGRTGMSYVNMKDGYFVYYTSGFTNMVAFLAATWYKVKLIMAPGATTYSIYINDTLYASPTLLGSATSVYEVGIGGNTANTSIYYDDIRVRTYAATSETHGSWTTEQSINVNTIAAIPSSGYYPLAVTLTVTLIESLTGVILHYGDGNSSNIGSTPTFSIDHIYNTDGLFSPYIEGYTSSGAYITFTKTNLVTVNQPTDQDRFFVMDGLTHGCGFEVLNNKDATLLYKQINGSTGDGTWTGGRLEPGNYNSPRGIGVFVNEPLYESHTYPYLQFQNNTFPANAFTISFYIYRYNNVTNQILLDINQPHNILVSLDTGGKIAVTYNGNTTISANQALPSNTSSTWDSNTTVNFWKLITLTYDGTYVKIYYDNILQTTSAPATLNIVTGDSFLLHSSDYPYLYTYNIKIGELLILSRCLSASDVSTLYNNTISEYAYRPHISYTVDTLTGYEPLELTITNSTALLYPTSTPYTYQWNFDDTATSSIYSPTHTYANGTNPINIYNLTHEAYLYDEFKNYATTQISTINTDSFFNNCVFYYPFSGNTIELISGINGLITHGSCLSGRLNDTGLFEPTLQLLDNSTLPNNDFTLCFWINLISNNAGFIPSNYGPETHYGSNIIDFGSLDCIISIQSTSGHLMNNEISSERLVIYLNGTAYPVTTPSYGIYYTSSAYCPSSWYADWTLVTIVKSSVHGIQLFINGALIITLSELTANINTATRSRYIGYGAQLYQDTPSHIYPIKSYLSGKLGETYLINTPLETAEISSLYTNSSNQYVLESCIASFTISDTTPYVNTTIVQFTNTSTGSPTMWAWDFGDGNTSMSGSPTHTYTSIGTFNITLQTSNAFSNSFATQQVTVSYEPIIANFEASPRTGGYPITVQFTDTSTGFPTSWSWQFGDNSSSTEQNPEKTFATTGTYDISLTANNPAYSDIETKPSYIVITEPSIDFTANSTTCSEQATVTFTAYPNFDVSGSYAWDFGDGYATTTITQSIEHVFATQGYYTITLSASNGTNTYTNKKSAYIHVLPPLYVDFTAYPRSGNAPLTVQFTDTSIGLAQSNWLWDFGDGSTSTIQNPSHVFTTQDTTYNIRLTKIDNNGVYKFKSKESYITCKIYYHLFIECVLSADECASFGVRTFDELTMGTDLPIIYASVFNEVTRFVQGELPDKPGIDDHGMRNFYSTVNEWGHRIINGVTFWGHRILQPASSVDHTPIKLFHAETFREDVIVADEWQFGTE